MPQAREIDRECGRLEQCTPGCSEGLRIPLFDIPNYLRPRSANVKECYSIQSNVFKISQPLMLYARFSPIPAEILTF
jgi:hypothetical protein